MDVRLAFIGFGNVARAFARILDHHRSRFEKDYSLSWTATGIATAHHGCVIADEPIDLLEAASIVERGGDLSDLRHVTPVSDAFDLIKLCEADILFETTLLDPTEGQPATSFIRAALKRGFNVVTANKGPVAFHYKELKELAENQAVQFRFEGTVMDGAPVFNLFERCLPGTRVLGFAGILNSTTNIILSGMEAGYGFEESLGDAQRRGIAEANADSDIDGWDAAMKAVVIANVLMDAAVHPDAVSREGIRNISTSELSAARKCGQVIRLIARGTRKNDRVILSVAPERIPVESLLGSAHAATNALVIETDLMGKLAIVEDDPGVEQTAYALLSDMIAIHQRRMPGDSGDTSPTF